jgi:hypothetical protein
VTYQEYAAAEVLSGIGITIALHPKTNQGWGWSIQNDKIVRDWEGPHATPAAAAAAALAWLVEYARKGLLCHHVHTEPIDDDLMVPWLKAFEERAHQ